MVRCIAANVAAPRRAIAGLDSVQAYIIVTVGSELEIDD